MLSDDRWTVIRRSHFGVIHIDSQNPRVEVTIAEVIDSHSVAIAYLVDGKKKSKAIAKEIGITQSHSESFWRSLLEVPADNRTEAQLLELLQSTAIKAA